jgi:hypothetical protein
MSQHGRLFSGHTGRSHAGPGDATAHARVNLKLAALACVNACLGPAAPPSMVLAGVAALCGAAQIYYGALTGQALEHEDATLASFGSLPSSDADPREARVAMARSQLVLGAVSYVSSRHGADACIEFTRAAIGTLCTSAIRYCEALAGQPAGESRVVDRTMHLDDGM